MSPWCAAALCALLGSQDGEKAAGKPVELSVKRISVLQGSGAFAVLEGPAPIAEGTVELALPAGANLSKTYVRIVDRPGLLPTVAPQRGTKLATDRPPPATIVVTLPKSSEGKSAAGNPVLRMETMLASPMWIPRYRFDQNAHGGQLTLDAEVSSAMAIGPDAVLEFSSADLRGGLGPKVADVAVFATPGAALAPGRQWVTLLSETLKSEELVVVRLGNPTTLARRPPNADRAEVFLRLPNSTNRFWPEGEITIFENGQPWAAAKLPSTAPGAVAELPLGAAPGVSITREERELERKVALTRRENDPPDAALTTGSATIVNRRAKATRFRVSKEVEGEVVAAGEDAKVTYTPNVLGKERRSMEISWTFPLAVGESKRLTFGTKIEVPSASGRDDP